MAIHLNIEAEDAQHLHSELQYLAGIYERGVDDDDGTVDHNHTDGIDLDDGTWELVGYYHLPDEAAGFLAELRNGPVATRHCRSHDDCGVVSAHRRA